MSIDLAPQYVALVGRILAEHVPEYEVRAFGSRVSGNAKPFSDLDLAIIGETPVSTRRLALLVDALSESDLPIKVDLLDWAGASEGLRRRIEQSHAVLQKARQAGALSDRAPDAGNS